MELLRAIGVGVTAASAVVACGASEDDDEMCLGVLVVVRRANLLD